MGLNYISWENQSDANAEGRGGILLFVAFAILAALFFGLTLSSVTMASGSGRRSLTGAGASSHGAMNTAARSELPPQGSAGSHAQVMETAEDSHTQLASFAGQTKVLERRVRIQRIVMGLDRIDEATLEMMPENADRLQPILEDLEDRAVALSDSQVVDSDETDAELSQIESSLRKLSGVVARMIQPEVTL